MANLSRDVFLICHAQLILQRVSGGGKLTVRLHHGGFLLTIFSILFSILNQLTKVWKIGETTLAQLILWQVSGGGELTVRLRRGGFSLTVFGSLN